MKALKSTLLVALIAGMGFFFAIRACMTKVGVTQVGVRVINYDLPGMKKGVEARDYAPGWGWDLGPLHRWILFDRTVQTLEMAEGDVEKGKQANPPVRPRTAEGYQLDVDVTIKYQIKPAEAHLLYETFGADFNRCRQQVAKLAEGTVREVFGDLNTADFYNPTIKRAKALESKARLQRALDDPASPSHIEVIDVLIRNVTFPENYEKLIVQKKVADQDVLVNRAREAARTAEQDAETIEAQTKAQVSVIEQEREAEKARRQATNQKQIAEIEATAQAYATNTQADADLVAAKRQADGVRLMKEAEAAGTQLKNEAMGGAGGRVLVALEAAKRLQVESAEISTAEVDFLNIDAMLEKLGLPKAGGAPPQEKAR
jgi:regulator of protease activity HflC (stomatin/prohibitin superfamily)